MEFDGCFVLRGGLDQWAKAVSIRVLIDGIINLCYPRKIKA